MLHKCLSILQLLLITPVLLISQDFERLSGPHISNFSKNIYQAENHNWGIAQDEDDNIYFGNNTGLLKYNGQSWELFPMPGNSIVRSLAIDEKGKIYTGSYEEFGYWKKDNYGNLNYYSFKNLLSDYNFHNEEIWKVIVHKGKVFYQAFSKIFVFDGQKVKIIDPEGIITSFSKIGDRLLIYIASKGLFHIQGNTLKLIDNKSFLMLKDVRAVVPYSRDEYIIASYEQGIYLYNIKDNAIKDWNPEFKNILAEKKVNRALKTPDDKYIIGTILNGLYIFDKKGKLLQNINTTNGLQNNTVLSIYYDKDNQLWVGLDTGIDVVFTDSDVTLFKNKYNNIGSVYNTIIKDQLLYVGTNQGLFYSNLNKDNLTGTISLEFKLVENSQDQVWYLGIYDNELFCGHNKGTFKVKKNKLKLVSNVSGGLTMIRITKNNQDYLLQSTYTNIVVYKKQMNKWLYSHTIKNFSHPVKYIQVDHLGNLWAGHLLKGLYKLKLNEELTEVVSETYYSNNNSFKSDNNVLVVKFRNRVLFINEGEVFTYNDFKDSIVPFDLLKNSLANNIVINNIFPVNDKYCWILTDKELLYYLLEEDKTVLLKSYPFNFFGNELIDKDEYILSLDTSRALVCLNNGLAMINLKPTTNLKKTKKVNLNRVVSSGNKNLNLPIKQEKENDLPVLSYKQNSIAFYYSYPQYKSTINFMVHLKGLDASQVKTVNNYKKYDRLPYGEYVFSVTAINESGSNSPELNYPFIINPPLYFNNWAKAIYIILFFGLIFMIRFYYRKRLKIQEKRHIEEKQGEIIKMRNDALQSEIQLKTEQLSDTTFSIIKKNELLMQIRNLLTHNKGKNNLNNQFDSIVRVIDRNISHSEDWKLFENNFEQAHKEFLSRLRKAYPDLTPHDLKLCAFLRMNLSSKKIGSLLAISTRSVENHRYRVRKKMNVDHNTNLTDFILKF